MGGQTGSKAYAGNVCNCGRVALYEKEEYTDPAGGTRHTRKDCVLLAPPGLFPVGQKVQLLVSKYRPDGTCETVTAPGPIGTFCGNYNEFAIIDLGNGGFFSKLPDSCYCYTRLMVVHPDNLVAVD